VFAKKAVKLAKSDFTTSFQKVRVGGQRKNYGGGVSRRAAEYRRLELPPICGRVPSQSRAFSGSAMARKLNPLALRGTMKGGTFPAKRSASASAVSSLDMIISFADVLRGKVPDGVFLRRFHWINCRAQRYRPRATFAVSSE
jgi:hypothetical protein